MEVELMNLDFLDNGLPVERIDSEIASQEIFEYRQYCKSIGKKPGHLTQEELEAFYATRK